MKIYISHSSGFDFKKELYQPISNSEFNNQHEFVLPHEFSSEQNDVKETFKDADLIIAEVSYPSTGQGLELGYANTLGLPIVCIYKEGSKYSGALETVTDKFYPYHDEKSLLEAIESILKS